MVLALCFIGQTGLQPHVDCVATADDERAAMRAVIAELHDAPATLVIDDLPPLPRPAARSGPRWDFTVMRHQAGRIDTDDAVALLAVSLFAAACRFGGVFG